MADFDKFDSVYAIFRKFMHNLHVKHNLMTSIGYKHLYIRIIDIWNMSNN